jgi:hypothetical protein
VQIVGIDTNAFEEGTTSVFTKLEDEGSILRNVDTSLLVLTAFKSRRAKSTA